MIPQKDKSILSAVIFIAILSACSSSNTKNEQRPTIAAPIADTIDKPKESVVEENITNVVYFDFDRYDLTPESRAILLVNAEKLKNLTAIVRLEGHADERGSNKYNMALGNRRALAVRDFLVLHGINAASMEAISYGEEHPVATGHDESSWAQNRRVEIKY